MSPWRYVQEHLGERHHLGKKTMVTWTMLSLGIMSAQPIGLGHGNRNEHEIKCRLTYQYVVHY